MRNFWRHLRTPTLVRRIMIAQMLLLTLLWCLFLTYILWENLRSPPMLTGSNTYETILTLVDRMDDRPQDRNAVLEKFSTALREGYGGGEDPKLSISLIVRKNKEIIYSSDGAPAGVTNTLYGKIQSIQSEGRTWTSRTLKSGRLRCGGNTCHACRRLELFYIPELAWILHIAATGVHSFSFVSRVAVNPYCNAPLEQGDK